MIQLKVLHVDFSDLADEQSRPWQEKSRWRCGWAWPRLCQPGGVRFCACWRRPHWAVFSWPWTRVCVRVRDPHVHSLWSRRSGIARAQHLLSLCSWRDSVSLLVHFLTLTIWRHYFLFNNLFSMYCCC